MMTINPEIFRAYDIRGRFRKDFDVDSARRIGNATALFLSRKYKQQKLTFVVGADVRISSPVLKKAVIDGITSQGSKVIDIGIVTTPLFYFAMHYFKNDGGIMVTASHNPPEYNGFKIRARQTEPIDSSSGLPAIKKLVERNYMQIGKKLGSVSSGADIRKKYVSALCRKVKIGKARIVIDAAGGCAAFILPELLANFPGVVYKPIFFKPDGSFSQHHPNPTTEEAQEFIKEELKAGSFDFGVLFDSDGDRIMFFDEFGNEVRGDFIVALLAKGYLKKYPGSPIVIDVNASRSVESHIRELGGKPLRSRRGYVFITRFMRKHKAVFGGEISDHFYFKELGYNESSMLALLKILEIISKTPQKLSHIVRPIQKYISGYEMNFSIKNKSKILRAIEKKFGKDGKVSKKDGLTIDFPDWWFNIRPSGTEPLIRLTIEAKTRILYDTKQKELSDIIRSSGRRGFIYAQ